MVMVLNVIVKCKNQHVLIQVAQRNDMLTGGVYQLRQGQQRRLAVRVKPAQNSGTLPIICQHIVSVEVGSVTVRYNCHNVTCARIFASA